jgi:hypothetical protein
MAKGLAAGRTAIGATALLAPGAATRVMSRREGSREGTKLLARMAAARDLALGLGVILALRRGGSVRGWLDATALVDSLDLAACLIARREIPAKVFPGAIALAALGAASSAWLARQVDTSSPAAEGIAEAMDPSR